MEGLYECQPLGFVVLAITVAHIWSGVRGPVQRLSLRLMRKIGSLNAWFHERDEEDVVCTQVEPVFPCFNQIKATVIVGKYPGIDTRRRWRQLESKDYSKSSY